MADQAKRVQKMRTVMIWANVLIGIFAIALLVSAGAAVSYGKLYEGKIFPGVSMLGVRLDGLSKDEARKQVQTAVDTGLAKGFLFEYKGKTVTIDATLAAIEQDASRDLLDFDLDTALGQAYSYGHDGSWQRKFLSQMRLRVYPAVVEVPVTVDRAGLADSLNGMFKAELITPKDAQFVMTAGTKEAPRPQVQSEQSGTVLEIDAAVAQLQVEAAKLAFAPIALKSHEVKPKVLATDLQPLVAQAEKILAQPMLTFTYEQRKLVIPTSTLAQWITATGTGSAVTVKLDAEAFEASIRGMAPDLEKEAKTGSLEVKDGKVVSFVGGTEGVHVDGAATLAAVESGWPASSTFPLVTKKVAAALIGEDPERIGIKELIGVGRSNFSGSPTNRRRNIAHGAELVNGTVIQPGEEFSMIKTLGPIDGEHKWLTELVIKGNETKPEYGGGLCQVGTTAFRAALNSGLPIVERRNHSYRVRYYEPAGTDATIYDPKPDFRFLNDTQHPILIHTEVKGDEAVFEFWGTKDGRKVEQSVSRVFNIVAPPAKKLVESLSLAPGKTKCTETAHAGADAEFDYAVTYASGEVKKETFHSHYRPWQAVCLVGVEKLTDPNAKPPVVGSPDAAPPVETPVPTPKP